VSQLFQPASLFGPARFRGDFLLQAIQEPLIESRAGVQAPEQRRQL
jgi:hypothetical protein